MKEHSLIECSIEEMVIGAHKLMRVGAISGEQALALIIWPDSRDMTRYVAKRRQSDLDEIIDDIIIAA